MGCCGDREKGAVSVQEKWGYINLDDFKSESCLTPFSYFWLYVFLLISLAVYGVDTFTAVNLLAFSRWAGQIEPAIPFHISRWIFAVCIIISFALLVWRWLRAIRAIRSGSIAQSYLDTLAVRIQSIRPGKKGRGWRRFLVFAELTKSKKGAEYVALFAYFSFESWMNTVLADGPRQVVNAITLYSVMQMDLLPGGENAAEDDGSSSVGQFFSNIKILAEDNNRRAVVLFGMLFTLVIWVLSVLKLIIAIVLYLIFLFHHIPAQDGTLSAYCRRKINKRLMRIVKQKVDKALTKGLALQDRAPTQPNLTSETKPSLPTFGVDSDKTPTVTALSRSTTQTTLPAYTSRPGTAAPDHNPTLPNLMMEKPPLTRSTTQSSAYSEAESLPGNATTAYSPLDRGSSPAPPVPPLPTGITPAMRTNAPMSRPGTTQPRFNPAPPPSVSARTTPGVGYRAQESQNSFGPYQSHDARSGTSYRSYTPATEPARSYTPGRALSPIESAPSSAYSSVNYGTGQPPVNPRQNGYPGRTFTPATQTTTPRPPPSMSPADSYARPYTPFSTGNSQQQTGYAPFDPSANTNTPDYRSQTPSSPGYRSYTPYNTTTPSNEYSAGPHARTFSPQPDNRWNGHF